MRNILAFALCIAVIPSFAQQKSASASSPAAQAIEKQVNFAQLERALVQWKTVQMPFEREGLTDDQVQAIEKMVQACHYLEDIFLQQSDPKVIGMMSVLEHSSSAKDKAILRMLRIQGMRYDLLAENKPFIGREPMAPQRGFFPEGLTREQIEQYVKAHPEKKDEIYNPFTIVRRKGQG